MDAMTCIIMAKPFAFRRHACGKAIFSMAKSDIGCEV